MVSHLLPRKWIEINDCLNDESCELTVMTFNLLADGLGLEDFIEVNQNDLVWEKRRDLIFEEIERINPDIMCFQEMNHFEDFKLKYGESYKGFFNEKKPSPCLRFGAPPDGCAIFIRKGKFEVKDVMKLKLTEGHSQVAIILRLGFGNIDISITTCHLKAKPGNEKIRMQQLRSIQNLIGCHNFFCNTQRLCSFICGDFNDVPESGIIEPTFNNFEKCYKSVYNDDIIDNKDEIYTTWKIRPNKEVKRIIDYILYSCDVIKNIIPIAYYSIPNKNLIPECRLPCHKYPSDHLALAAKFIICK